MPHLIPRSYHEKLEDSLNELPVHDMLLPRKILPCYDQLWDSSEAEIYCWRVLVQNGKAGAAGLSVCFCCALSTQSHGSI